MTASVSCCRKETTKMTNDSSAEILGQHVNEKIGRMMCLEELRKNMHNYVLVFSVILSEFKLCIGETPVLATF